MSLRPGASTVCVVGGGGREHALARVLARSAPVVVAPGNPGMVEGGEGDLYPISVTDRPVEELEASLFVIGPEAPLVDGLADRLRADGHKVVGPGLEGAALEGSKGFMKHLLLEAGVPTADYGVFDEPDPALAFLDQLSAPYVIKTDGLAAGKGVLVTDQRAEAEADVRAKLSGRAFGDAGRQVVIEEGLQGVECSLLVLCDGRRILPLDLAQDAKRLGDGDEGPNTGGMGAYAPLPWASPALADQLVEEAVEPLVHALRRRGIDYRGVLYAGVMVTEAGPKVLEYNVRFGDPEAEVVLPLLQGDVVALLMAVAEGRLTSSVADAVRSQGAAVCVVAAAEGYPGEVKKGRTIDGLGPTGQLEEPVEGATVLHAATAKEGDRFVTNGGRVLALVGEGPDLGVARSAAYRALGSVGWPGMQYRSDIAPARAEPPAEAGVGR